MNHEPEQVSTRQEEEIYPRNAIDLSSCYYSRWQADHMSF